MTGNQLGQARLAGLEAGWPGRWEVIGRAAGGAVASPPFATSRVVAVTHTSEPELCRSWLALSPAVAAQGEICKVLPSMEMPPLKALRFLWNRWGPALLCWPGSGASVDVELSQTS